MTRTTHPFLRTLATLLAVGSLVAVLGAPAGASGLSDERSPRIRIKGAVLKTSDKIGSSDDPAIGKTAPTLVGLSLAGKKISVGNDGKPRVVLFLSHSCPHCQAEVPRIVALAKQGKLDGVEIDTIATNTSKSLQNWPPSKWLKREHWPFAPVLADDAKLRAFFDYGGQAFPYFVFVDANGKVAARAAGELDPAAIAAGAAHLAKGESVFAKS